MIPMRQNIHSGRWPVTLALAFALLVAFSPAARAGDDDPFAPKDKKAPASAKAKKETVADRIDFQVSVEPRQAKRGETVLLKIIGTPRPKYHTYPITKRTSFQEPSGLSRISYQVNPALKPLIPLQESGQTEFAVLKQVGVFLEYKRPFTWTQDILILREAPPGEQRLRFTIHLQVCDLTCLPGDLPFEVTIDVAGGEPVPYSREIQDRLAAKPQEIQLVVIPPALLKEADVKPEPKPSANQTIPIAAPKSMGLISLLVASIFGAIAMLFTPCVFPMIPITVSYFLKQSEKEHHNALLTASVYSLTIVVVLALSVLVLGELIVNLANDAWLNLGLGALLVFFALSLFGMYEIELPSGLARFTSAHERKGGYLGAMFMSLTFTITSFTCTGPFLGPLLVAVKETQMSFGERLIGAVAYSATFAAPFFVLALFPSLMKRLPKSGGWLNAVKVVMGFLELAAALKFLANTDLAWNPGRPMFFNYETVLCAWIAFSILCGCYLLGIFRLPHDTPLEHLGVARMMLASLFFGLALYMVPAIWRVTPQGIVGQWLVAFLPLDTRVTPIDNKNGQSELTWLRDYQEAWELANKEGKLIFIDFTGQNCVNCRDNEKNLFPLPVIQEELAKYVRVQLYTDSVPDPRLSAAESKREGTRNFTWRKGTFGDDANPLYAVLRPDKVAPFEDGPDGAQKLKGEVLGVRKGKIPESHIKDFEEFLSGPLKQGANAVPASATAEFGERGVSTPR